MITAPENNIKLTDEQTASIEEAQNRLISIESQINVQTKNLRTLKIDTDNVTKDRLLLEEEVKKINDQIVPLKKIVEDLTSQKENLSIELNTSRNELSEVNRSSDAKMLEMADKVKEFEKRENELIHREDSLAKKELNLSHLENSLNEKHTKIREFIENL